MPQCAERSSVSLGLAVSSSPEQGKLTGFNLFLRSFCLDPYYFSVPKSWLVHFFLPICSIMSEQLQHGPKYREPRDSGFMRNGEQRGTDKSVASGATTIAVVL